MGGPRGLAVKVKLIGPLNVVLPPHMLTDPRYFIVAFLVAQTTTLFHKQ